MFEYLVGAFVALLGVVLMVVVGSAMRWKRKMDDVARDVNSENRGNSSLFNKLIRTPTNDQFNGLARRVSALENASAPQQGEG